MISYGLKCIGGWRGIVLPNTPSAKWKKANFDEFITCWCIYFLLKVIVRLACNATPLIYVSNHLSRACFTFQPNITVSVAVTHVFIIIIFPLHHYRVFFIVSPSGCSHKQHNDIIYDYVCTKWVKICAPSTQKHKLKECFERKEEWDCMFELLA